MEKNQESEKVAKNKRRAQVRKAQVQHRQRKANYVKQLEENIAGIRDQIADAEGGRQRLMSENEAIRAQLAGPAGLDQAVVPGLEFAPMPSYVPILEGEIPIQGFDIDPNFDMDYSLLDPNLDEYMNTATTAFNTFEMSSCTNSGSGSSAYGSPQFMGSSDTSSPYPFIPEMATDQPQQAMNLFLA